MENVARVGIDLGKGVFHVTAVDAEGAVLERKRLRRAGLRGCLSHLPRGCEVAMESCGGAHHWARLALKEGLRPALLSPQFVKPYVKSNKNDVADADAIAEASSRPGMRFVEVKSVEQEHVQQVHRARQLAVKQATAQRNQLHALLLEYGVASPRGTGACLAAAVEDGDNELPAEARALLRELGDELRRLETRVAGFDVRIGALARRMPAARRGRCCAGRGTTMPSTWSRRPPGGRREAAPGAAGPLRPRAAAGTVRTAVQRGRPPAFETRPLRGAGAALRRGSDPALPARAAPQRRALNRGQAATAAHGCAM